MPTIFNARDYGAAGDGLADDTAALQAAIDAAAAAGGGEVYVPPGTYSLTAQPGQSALLLRAGVSVSGHTAGTTILQVAAGSGVVDGIIRAVGDNVSAAHLTLDGNRGNHAGAVTGWVGDGHDNMTLDSLQAINASGNGFDLRGNVSHLDFRNNTASQNGQDGILADGLSDSVWRDNAAMQNDGDGFNLGGSVQVFDSFAFANGGDGISLSQGSRGSPGLTSGEVYANGGAGIAIEGTSGAGPGYLEVSFMHVFNNRHGGIAVAGGANGALDYNQLQDNAKAAGESEITLSDTSAYLIRKNLIQNGVQGAYGVLETGAASGNNQVSDNTILHPGQRDVSLTGTGSEETNTITTVSWYGTADADYIETFSGADDVIYGGAGTDNLYSPDGRDVLIGGAGRDVMAAQGTATYRFTALTDSYRTAAGSFSDRLYAFDPATQTLDVAGLGFGGLGDGHGSTLQLSYNAAQNVTYLKSLDPNSEGQRFELMLSGNVLATLTDANFQPLIAGSATRDVLSGTAGPQTLLGLGGADTLSGNAGDDRLVGGTGGDKLYGGAGADAFVFTTLGDSLRTQGSTATTNRDTVMDFDAQSGDTLDLTSLGFRALGDGHDGTLKVILNTAGDLTALRSLDADANGRYFEVMLRGNHFSELTANTVLLANTTGESVSNSLVQADSRLTGSAGADRLTGTAGTDLLSGLAGNDTLTGSLGRDDLDGGLGMDRLSGGTGGDIFFFSSAQESYRTVTTSFSDVITDFTDDGIGHDRLSVWPMGFIGIGDGTGDTLKIDYNPRLDRTYIRDLEGDGLGHFFQVVLSGDHSQTLTRQNFIFEDSGQAVDLGLLGLAGHPEGTAG